MKGALFHLAFPIHDVAAAKRFLCRGAWLYVGSRVEPRRHVRTCRASTRGPSDDRTPCRRNKAFIPDHFGLTFLSKDSWQRFLEQAQAKLLPFYQQPRVRFPGTRIEHHTFFLEDPSGNLLEFKHYTHESAIFGERDYSEVGDSL